MKDIWIFNWWDLFKLNDDYFVRLFVRLNVDNLSIRLSVDSLFRLIV